MSCVVARSLPPGTLPMILMLLAGVMPSVLAAKGYAGREKWLFPLNDSLKPKVSNMLHALFKPATTS
jgi:hypothetical protein